MKEKAPPLLAGLFLVVDVQFGAVLDDAAVEDGLHDALLVRRQVGDGLEQQSQASPLGPRSLGSNTRSSSGACRAKAIQSRPPNRLRSIRRRNSSMIRRYRSSPR